MRLFDKHPNKRMEVDTVEALQESLVELYDSLMTDDHIVHLCGALMTKISALSILPEWESGHLPTR